MADCPVIHYTLYGVTYTAFLISFSGDLFYIPKELALARKEQSRHPGGDD
jgi:hypothetical protein